MFLSIIIPHYNLPYELLERCLQSIIALGMPDNDYEIIIVDDGSTTKPYWVTSLSDNIKLITADHGGPGNARNIGIEQANGTYIMFVDADDYLLNNGDIFKCIDKLKSERPQILRYRYVIEHEGGEKPVQKRGRIRFSNTISGASYMERYNLSGSPWVYFFQRELAVKKKIVFPTEIFHEDEEFNTILHYHAQTLIDSDAKLYSYCIRSGSTTANNSKEFEESRISDFIHIIERINHFAQANNSKCNIIQTKAIAHKLDMLSVDAILNMMYAGTSAKEIVRKCNEKLTPIGLYPLRKASYSMKYRIFRKLANSRAGMKFLRMIIPSQKPTKR